jgi:hypothetical protein
VNPGIRYDREDARWDAGRNRHPAAAALADGDALDYSIAGTDVDCKFSHLHEAARQTAA